MHGKGRGASFPPMPGRTEGPVDRGRRMRCAIGARRIIWQLSHSADAFLHPCKRPPGAFTCCIVSPALRPANVRPRGVTMPVEDDPKGRHETKDVGQHDGKANEELEKDGEHGAHRANRSSIIGWLPFRVNETWQQERAASSLCHRAGWQLAWRG